MGKCIRWDPRNNRWHLQRCNWGNCSEGTVYSGMGRGKERLVSHSKHPGVSNREKTIASQPFQCKEGKYLEDPEERSSWSCGVKETATQQKLWPQDRRAAPGNNGTVQKGREQVCWGKQRMSSTAQRKVKWSDFNFRCHHSNFMENTCTRYKTLEKKTYVHIYARNEERLKWRCSIRERVGKTDL